MNSLTQAQPNAASEAGTPARTSTLREAVEAARAEVEQARADAAQARADAAQARADAGQRGGDAQSAGDGNTINFRYDNGRILIDQTDASGITTTQTFDPAAVIPPQVPDMLLILVLGLIGMIMAFPIGRAIARYIDRRGTVARVPEEVSQRFASIEQAVDAVAIEVERMSEANRYTTRLLNERLGTPDVPAGARTEPLRAPAASRTP
jgi:hypothetical protein